MGVLQVWFVEAGLYAILLAAVKAERPLTLAAVMAAIAGLVLLALRAHRLWGHLVGLFQTHRSAALVGIVCLSLTFPFFLRSSPYWIFIGTMALLYVTIGQGLNLQIGTAGVLNLAGSAFSGLGAYTVGILMIKTGVPSAVAPLAGSVVAVVVGAILFIPILKTRGHYLALATIAFVFIFNILANNLEFTGGPQGIKNIPTLTLFGYPFTTSPHPFGIALPYHANFFYAALGMASLVTLLLWRLQNSWVGLTLNTLRDDEIAAKCMGVSVARYKLLAFSLGNLVIGFAGGFYALMVGFISPPDFTFGDALVMVSIIILGGLDSIPGIIVAACLLIALPERFRFLQEYRLLLYGVTIVLMLLFRPKGLWPAGVRRYGLSEGPRSLAAVRESWP